MSLVNVIVASDEAVPAPLPGVVVTVVSTSPYQAIARATSDSLGIAGFDLPDGLYELRAYKRGVFFQPFRIAVEGDGAYDMAGRLQTTPSSEDPRICRVSGRFVNLGNRPMGGVTLLITGKGETGYSDPKVVDSQMVVGQGMYLKTNADGFATADLFRGGEFFLTFSGDDDTVWNFKVPDRDTANLIDLIHPQPLSATWGVDDNAVELVVGGTVQVPINVFFSDFQTRTSGVASWLDLSSSDPAVIAVDIIQDQLLVKALAAGSAVVSLSAKSGIFPARVPAYSLSSQPLQVTIT